MCVVCMRACAWAHLCMQVHVHMRISACGGPRLISTVFLSHSPLGLQMQDLSLDPELTELAALASQLAQGSPVYASLELGLHAAGSSAWLLYVFWGARTLVLTLEWQVFYPLSHVPCFWFPFWKAWFVSERWNSDIKEDRELTVRPQCLGTRFMGEVTTYCSEDRKDFLTDITEYNWVTSWAKWQLKLSHAAWRLSGENMAWNPNSNCRSIKPGDELLGKSFLNHFGFSYITPESRSMCCTKQMYSTAAALGNRAQG